MPKYKFPKKFHITYTKIHWSNFKKCVNLFQKWYAERLSYQLSNRKSPSDVKVSLKLSDLKPLHAKWVVEMYDYLKQESESITKGFVKVGTMEALKFSQKIYRRCENPFDDRHSTKTHLSNRMSISAKHIFQGNYLLNKQKVYFCFDVLTCFFFN